jgi:FHA domain
VASHRHVGDGSVDHLDESVEQPGMLELKEGTYTLGRSAPADLVIGVPTVSAKHAELKVGEADAPPF